MAGRWLDVNSTAEELGISTDAVRKRIARGSLESDRRDGHVLVWLEDGWTEAGRESQVNGGTNGGALVEVLTDQVAYLRSQLDAEREAHKEARRIIAGLVQRVPALEAGAEPSAAPQPREEPVQEAANGAGGPRPPAGGTEAQNGAEKPWWRRLFG